MNAMALFSFILELFFTFSTTEHREPLREITAKKQKSYGCCVSRGCDWLVMKKVKVKP